MLIAQGVLCRFQAMSEEEQERLLAERRQRQPQGVLEALGKDSRQDKIFKLDRYTQYESMMTLSKSWSMRSEVYEFCTSAI